MRFLTFTAAALLTGVVCVAQSLDGRVITLKAGAQTSVDVPLSLPFDGTAPDGTLVVKQDGTGKAFPAMVRNGEFIFVPEGAMPNAELTYRVAINETKSPERVQITQDGPDKLKVTIDDEYFTTYNYSKDYKKPFLWPVISGGSGITRDWPMGKENPTKDHPHHKSMWSAYGNINGADCWGEGQNSGAQVVDEVTFGSGDAYGWIHSRNTWVDNTGKPVIAEEREYRFYPSSPKGRLMDVSVTFTAAHGDAYFKDTKEGGIFALRIHDLMNEAHGGTITMTDGRVGEKACWGKASPWCDYSGAIDGVGMRGITIMDNPANFRYPTTWHVRAYGLFGANPFGYNDFTGGAQNGDHTMKSGEKLTFKYRVFVHAGNAADAKVEDRYADYTAPPQVAWAK